jgi:hypothetical protein
MDDIFKALLPEEYAQLKNAIPLITILIGGADGDLDSKERTWAEKVTNIRSYSLPEEYRGFYTVIGHNFPEELDKLIEELPDDVAERQMEISRRLASLNDILSKLDSKVAAAMYDELKSFARHVARASGGFLTMWSISAEEKRWISLPMIREFTWTPPSGNEPE